MSVTSTGATKNRLQSEVQRFSDTVVAYALMVLALACQIRDAIHSRAAATSAQYIDREKTKAHNIVGAAVTLGLSVIMLILMAIVAGYFVMEAPSNGAFSGAIDQVESVGGTAFILLAVALLAVPVVAIVGYFMRSGLGAFISMGGGRR